MPTSHLLYCPLSSPSSLLNLAQLGAVFSSGVPRPRPRLELLEKTDDVAEVGGAVKDVDAVVDGAGAATGAAGAKADAVVVDDECDVGVLAYDVGGKL